MFMSEVSTVKLVRKDTFKEDAFESISDSARKTIQNAQDSDILALTITMNSPLKITNAEIFNRALFDKMLASSA